MADSAQSVTSLELSPEAERKQRMIRYTWAMTIRVICLVLGMFLEGWLMWIAFAGAIFLPYFAVVIANTQGAAGAPRAVPVAPKLVISADAFKANSAAEGDARGDESSKES